MTRQASDDVIPGVAAISVGDPGTEPPEGWARGRLTDVARLESGHTPSRKHPEWWGGDVPWVSLPDAREHHGRVINDTIQKTNEKGLANSAARWLPKDTVCLSRTASVGYVFRLGRPMATSQDFVNWVCSEAVEPRFLMHALLAEGDHLLNFGKGTTHTTIYFPEVLAFHLNLAPLPEQLRIVEKVEALLDQVNKAKDRLDRVKVILKRFRQAVLAAACSGKLTEEWRDENPGCSPPEVDGPPPETDDLPPLPDLPEQWMLVQLDSVARRFQYGTSAKADADARSGVPVIRMSNIQDSHLTFDDLKYIAKARVEKNCLLAIGDVLFNRTNSPELVGKTAVVEHLPGSALFASYIIRMQADPSVVRPLFVSWWLNSAWGRQWARHVRTDGVSQSNINSTKLAAMPLPLPSLKEQDEAVRVGRRLLALADAIEARVSAAGARAEKLPQSILSKAFKGELVPTEAELARAEGRSFESAEEMLRRVKADHVHRSAQDHGRRRGRRRAG